MSRPTTKSELLKAANEQFEKMWKLIASMTEEEQQAVFDFGDNFKKIEAHWKRDHNLRDVLVHLYEWHQLLLNWVEANQKGEGKPFLPSPYNWKTYGRMNEAFWEKHQTTSCEDARKMLLESHDRVMETIDSFSNEELFEKTHYTWTGTSNVGSYCISVTSSHYDWAAKKIKTHIKAYRDSLKE